MRVGCSPGPKASQPLPLLLFLTAMCIIWHARQGDSELLLRSAPLWGGGEGQCLDLFVGHLDLGASWELRPSEEP